MAGRKFYSFDPASGDRVWHGYEADLHEVAKAVADARSVLPFWAATPLADRIAIIINYKKCLQASVEPFAELISRETGKPLWESKAEVASMIGKIDISIKAQAERAGENHSTMGFGEAVLRHRSHGVMAVLGPYNFPGHLPNGHIVPALLAGNVVVFKPSEHTPAVGAMMANIWEESGLPKAVFSLVQGGRDVGAALVAEDIDGLLFTGSAQAGMYFRRIFAERPKVMLALELGGNNPLVVWDARDIQEAASLIVQSAFITTGQRCSCARRLIVPDHGFGTAVIEAVAALAGRLVIGAWNDTPEPFMGPLISQSAAKTAQTGIEAIQSMGGRAILPGGPVAGRGKTFVSPAVFDVTGCDVMDEEIFAPVLQVTRVPSFEAALIAANATRFGLSAGLVSDDVALWTRFVSEVRAGVINRNRPITGAAGNMPFGGLGESGNHRPGAYYAADYCAFPVASFEAPSPAGNLDTIAPWLRS